MYELIQVTEHAYYIQCPAKIGLIQTGETTVCLIDSGNDKDAGKKVKRILDEKGWTLEAVYNTHSHADHIGGNAYLQKQTGCRIYAPGIEQAFTRHPILEPSFLYGGCPPGELRHKFLLAQESDALPLTEEALPAGVSLIGLPGHSFDMVGFAVQEGVVYLADCLASRETLEKYALSFLVDVKAYLETLEKVQTMKAALFVPAHAEPTEDIFPLAEENIRAVRAAADTLTALCREPVSFDGLLKKVFCHYGLTMTMEQHALVGSTVRSYLTYLAAEGRVHPFLEDNLLLWQA